MSEFKHTSAPWYVSKRYGFYEVWAEGDDSIEIAAIRHRPVDSNHEIEKANAVLMAESPNLLKCLIEMVDVHDSPCRFDHKGFCQAHFLDHESGEGCRVANAKAAIERVRGK